MRSTNVPICHAIKRLGPDDAGCSLTTASLVKSVKCGCRYCGAVSEASPEHGRVEKLRVSSYNRSIMVAYVTNNWAETRRDSREFFILNEQDDLIFPVRRPIAGKTDSKQSLETIKSWLDTCLATHTSSCGVSHDDNGLPKLPDRVLEVSLDTPRRIRLIDTKNRRGQYACLSHCWGGQQPLTTTRKPDTLSVHQQDIQEENLPKTFQDAITIILELDIHHIWIDSLCIIQDDEKDWQIQSAQMADIYANSTVTIAASASSGPHQGLFRVANPGRVGLLLSGGCDIHTRQPLDHNASKLPLLQRGWVFQERLLSPRIIHFADDELMWECMERADCECGGINDAHSKAAWTSLKGKWRLVKEDYSGLLRHWSTLINEYSRLKLTKPSDIFPAISGIAKSFGKVAGWEYVAGIWKETLIYGLLWHTFTPKTRCVPWRAPTFSWASVDSKVKQAYEDFLVPVATVLEVECCPLGDDPTGQLESGFIVLSGVLTQATLRLKEKDAPESEDSDSEVEQDFYVLETLPLDGGSAVRHDFYPDFNFKQKDEEVDDGETVFCLKICREEPENGKSTYLVLLKQAPKLWEYHGIKGDCEFKRIGLMRDYDNAFKEFKGWFEQTSPQHAVQYDAIVKII